MSTTDLEFVIFVVAAFTLFGGVLGWASWEESCAARRKRKIDANEVNLQSNKPNANARSLNAEFARSIKGGRRQRRAF